MGSSFVSIGDQGFWMRDGALEVWLRLLALHVEDPSQSGSVAAQIRDQWLLASRGFFVGCIPVGLDEAVSTPEGAAVVRGAINSLLAALEKGPGCIPRSVLNVMGLSGQFGADVSTSSLIEVARAFNDLLDGEVTSRASDRAFVPASSRR